MRTPAACRGTSMDRPAGSARQTTVDRERALARWENEGGHLPIARARADTTRPVSESAPSRTEATTGESQPMTMHRLIRVGRVYDSRGGDGARVLVDRLWPRGLTKKQADLDEWRKEIAPSAALRTWYGHDPDRFDEFVRRYREELDDPVRADAWHHLRELARRHDLILLTAARRVEISAAAVLADLLGVVHGRA